MSWGTSSGDAVAKDSITVKEIALSHDARDKQIQQMAAAVEAAKLLAGVVGREDDQVMVTISGHVNPDHAPRAGYAHEMVTVSVTARPKEDGNAT